MSVLSILSPFCLFASLSGFPLVIGARTWLRRRCRRPRVVALTTTLACCFASLAAGAALVLGEDTPEAIMLTLVAPMALAAGLAFYMNQLIPVVSTPMPRRVLAVGAHPDDLELACGATLAKLSDSGHEVRTVVMSAGRQGGSDCRPAEAERAAAFMGAASIQVWDFPDTRLAESAPEMVRAIEQALHQFNPDIILTHSAHDQHQDHQAVHLATLRAARQRHSILCFESPSSTRQFDPNGPTPTAGIGRNNLGLGSAR